MRFDTPGPILFRQRRVGRFGKPFDVLKFRTMIHASGQNQPQLTVGGDPQLTGMGRFLRRYKLDELPQLVNVLRGEMSLVGPRPEVPEYVALYSMEQRRVLQARPGITSAASLSFHDEEQQLAARNNPYGYYVAELMPRKLQHDIDYLDRVTFSNDLRLILGTITMKNRFALTLPVI